MAIIAAAGIATMASAGHTVLEIAAADVDTVREIRDVAATRIAEKRAELELLEAELAVLDQALAESAPDGG
jgi:hypothetical protein